MSNEEEKPDSPANESLLSGVRGAWLLAAFAIAATGLLAIVQSATESSIDANKREALLRQLNEVLPQEEYDNALAQDTHPLTDPAALGLRRDEEFYVARRDGDVRCILLPAIARDGYSGDIKLLIGILNDGSLSGVRVTEHKETPGLGDAIEVKKSDWILDFIGKSLSKPRPQRWAVTKDGGDFDALTGATITPRAVVKAVKNALLYFDEHRASLLATPNSVPAGADNPNWKQPESAGTTNLYEQSTAAMTTIATIANNGGTHHE